MHAGMWGLAAIVIVIAYSWLAHWIEMLIEPAERGKEVARWKVCCGFLFSAGCSTS